MLAFLAYDEDFAAVAHDPLEKMCDCEAAGGVVGAGLGYASANYYDSSAVVLG